MFIFDLAADLAEWVGDLLGDPTPDVPTPDPATLAAPAITMPPLDAGTRAVFDMTNQALADAGAIYRDAMDPGSVPAADVAAASERIDNAAAHSAAMQGETYRQEIANDIAHDEFVRQTLEEAHRLQRDVTVVTHGEA